MEMMKECKRERERESKGANTKGVKDEKMDYVRK